MNLKRLQCMTLVTATTILFSGCFSSSYHSTLIIPDATNAVASFASDVSPLEMIQAGDTYYSFIGTFGETSYALSVSDDIATTNIVYKPSKPVIIWFFEANENYATWCETSESGDTFLYYDKANNSVTEIFSRADDNENYQLNKVALYNDFIYFANIDYTNETADIMCYHIPESSLTSIYSAEFTEDYAITNLSLSENILTSVTNVKGKSKLINIDLDTMENPTVTELPKKSYFVFDAKYDASTSTYALYYISTNNKEYIGTYKAGQESIENIFTFSNSYYAYQDSIQYIDGDIYWVIQANSKSITTTPERYALVIWNHETDELFEYSRTYNFCSGENGFYYFSFDNSSTYDNVLINIID